MNVKDIIKNFNIDQIHFSPTIKKKVRINIRKKTKLAEYKNKTKPVLFYGYDEDLTKKLISKHRGIRVVLWKENKSESNKFLIEQKNNSLIKNFIVDKNDNVKEFNIVYKSKREKKSVAQSDNMYLLYIGNINQENKIIELINEFQRLSKYNKKLILRIIYEKIEGTDIFIKNMKNIIQCNIKNVIFNNYSNIEDIEKEIDQRYIGINDFSTGNIKKIINERTTEEEYSSDIEENEICINSNIKISIELTLNNIISSVIHSVNNTSINESDEKDISNIVELIFDNAYEQIIDNQKERKLNLIKKKKINFYENLGIDIIYYFNQTVGILTIINDQKNLDNILTNFNQQLYVNKKLFLVIQYKIEIDEINKKFKKDDINVEIIKIDETQKVGYFFNEVIENMKMEGIEIFSIFNEEDIYEPRYLLEQVAYLNKKNCDIVGKYDVPIFVPEEMNFFVNKDSIGKNNIYSDFCDKSTVLFRLDKIDIKFNENIQDKEVNILEELKKSNKEIYLTSSHNFTSVKRLASLKNILLTKLNNKKEKKIRGQILNVLFDKIFVINLKSHVLRKKIFKKNNERHNINFTFFKGVQGNSDPECIRIFNAYKKLRIADPSTSALEKKVKKKMIKTVGQIGYLKSMLNIFLHAKEKKLKRIVIFDDDCVLHKDFNNLFFNTLKKIPNFDILKIGTTWHKIKYNLPHLKSPFFTSKSADGSFAVCYDAKCYDFMIKNIQRYNIPFDMGCLRDYQENNYTCYPFLAIADVFESSITKQGRNLKDLSHKLMWNLDNFWFKSSIRKVSVVIIVDNNENNILNSLYSIRNQTYFNIEIIIINNNSTDKSLKIIKKFSRKYQSKFPIKLINLDSKKDIIYIKKLAVTSSTGDYIMFQNPNHVSLFNKIEIQMNEIIKKNILISLSSINIDKQLKKYSNSEIKNRVINKNINLIERKIDTRSMIVHKQLYNRYEFIEEDNLSFIFNLYSNYCRLKKKVFSFKKSLFLEFIEKNLDGLGFMHYKDKILSIK